MYGNKPEFLARLARTACFALDMDGTFYLGDQLIPGALQFVQAARRSGRRVVFLTNNSSKSADFYRRKLARMGLPIGPEEILTSGQATALYLNRERPGRRVYVMGNPILKGEMADMGVQVVEEDPDLCVIAFDTTLDYAKLTKVCDYIRNGMDFISTHPDFNCPTETGFIPDIGAMLAFIKASTGREPRMIVGKPHGEIVRALCQQTGLPPEAMAMVGDRLYTDVATGVDHGLLAILVLSGETQLKDVETSPVTPHLIFDRLGDMTELIEEVPARA